MTEKSSPSPVDDRQTTRAAISGLQVTLWILLVITMGVLTANVWLIFDWKKEQRSNSREHAFWVLCQPTTPAVERKRAFLNLVAAGHREWRSADLHELDLARVSLPDAQLQGGFFVRCIFSGANLSRARFCNGSLEQADLSGANLAEADLSETQLLRANLKNANLRRAKLQATSIEQVQAGKCDFMLADLSDANCLMADLTEANLDGANLSGARLEAAVLKGARLTLTRLDDADLKNADFTDANWWRARGLRADQVEILKANFAPKETSPRELKEDFQKWLSHSGGKD